MEAGVERCSNDPLHEEGITIHGIPAASLNREIYRLQTFTTWPVSYILPSELARWGFFYVGSRDIVRCYFCKIELGNWEVSDVVPQEHLKWSRHCPLMRKLPTTNVPLDANFLDLLVDVVPDVTGAEDEPEWDTTGDSGYGEINPNETQNIASVSNQTALQSDSVPVYRPKFPYYQVETVRVASFKEWPKSMKQTPKQMADAGFFYTGKSDIVQCFCCGGALRDWLTDDEPWMEHAANYSGCYYLNLMKSADFIGKCQKRTKDNTPHQAVTDVPEDDGGFEDEVPDDKICKLCYTKPYDTVFMPCGHVVACGKCASATTKCPLCNEQYTNIVRIYLS